MSFNHVKRCRECRKEIEAMDLKIQNTKNKREKAQLIRQFEKITDQYREEC